MNTHEWRENEDALKQYFKVAPQLSIKRVKPVCPECKSADYDPVHGCFTSHGKFRAAA